MDFLSALNIALGVTNTVIFLRTGSTVNQVIGLICLVVGLWRM